MAGTPEPADTMVYAPARILASRTRSAPTDADLALINERFAIEPLAADDIFTFDLVASTDAVDSYSTHMDVATSLSNFARDFTDGQALLDSHIASRLPLGGTYRGVLEPIDGGIVEGETATHRVLASAYLQRSLSENYRVGIIGGTYRRCSVGFLGRDLRFICDIDGKDLWDSDYWPGQRLADGRRVTFTVVNARAMEVSLVFRNSTPGALVARVQELITARAIPPREVAALETAWQTRFVAPSPLVRGVTLPKGDRMEPKELIQAILARAGKTISVATRAKLESAASSMEDAVVAIGDLLAAEGDAEKDRAIVAALGENVTLDAVRALQAEAEAGRAYRTSIIDATVQARVAVAGNDFDADAYRARLDKRDLADLEDERAAWSQQRAQKYTPGRRIPAGALPEGETKREGGVVETVE